MSRNGCMSLQCTAGRRGSRWPNNGQPGAFIQKSKVRRDAVHCPLRWGSLFFAGALALRGISALYQTRHAGGVRPSKIVRCRRTSSFTAPPADQSNEPRMPVASSKFGIIFKRRGRPSRVDTLAQTFSNPFRCRCPNPAGVKRSASPRVFAALAVRCNRVARISVRKPSGMVHAMAWNE